MSHDFFRTEPTNAQQLENEIRRRLPATIPMQVYEQPLRTWVHVPVTLSAGQITQIETIISNHIPDFRERDEIAEAMQLEADLRDFYLNNPSPTEGQLLQAIRKLIRAFLLRRIG